MSTPHPPEPGLFTQWPASTLLVCGNDRARFLHNFCTADVLGMQTGAAREAFFLNAKGHILAHAVVFVQAESIEVLVLQRNATALAAHLDRYVMRDHVSLSVPDSPPVLLDGVPASQVGDSWLRVPLVHHPVWVNLTAQAMDEIPVECVVGNEDDFTALRVRAGWPLMGVDFGDAALPQELNRDHLAISFAKGCYLGQETVARIDALGHVNKQLVQVEAERLETGLELRANEQPVGTVSSAAHIGTRWQGIAMVRRGSSAVGQRLQSECGPATIVPPPYEVD